MPELVQIDGFGQVIKGAGLQCTHRVVGRSVCRDDDAAFGALVLLQPFDQFQTLPVWQAHVGHQHGETLALQQIACLLQIACAADRVAATLQGDFVECAQIGFVINDQNLSGGGGGCHMGPRSCAWGGDIYLAGLCGVFAVGMSTKKALPSSVVPAS